MEVIPFNYNWNNKLDCNAFTTIRLYNPKKHFEGNRVKAVLKGVDKGDGTLMSVKRFLLKDLNPFMSYLDTGYGVAECTKVITTMYPNVNFKTTLLAFILIVKDKQPKQ